MGNLKRSLHRAIKTFQAKLPAMGFRFSLGLIVVLGVSLQSDSIHFSLLAGALLLLIAPFTRPSESQEKLKLIVESMQEGMFIINGKAELLEINRVAREMAELQEHQGVGSVIKSAANQYIWPDGSAVAQTDLPAIQALMTGKAVVGRVLGFVRSSGEVRWLRISSDLFLLPSDKVSKDLSERKVLTTFTDITDLVLAQREIEEFFNLSPDFMCVSNFEGFFTRVNPSYIKQMGVTQEEYDVKSAYEFLYEEDYGIAAEAIKRIQNGESVKNVELRAWTKDGKLRRVSWTMNARLDTGMIYSTGRDITDEHEAIEHARKISEENQALNDLLERTQAVAMIGSWSLDFKNGTQNWSKQVFRIMGLDPSQPTLPAQEYASLVHPDDRERWLNEFNLFMADENVHMIRYRFLIDNKIIWIECIAQGRRGENGTIDYVSGTCQDITERVTRDERHAYVLEALGIGVWNYDLEAGRMEWDKGMYSMYDARPEDFPDPMDAWRNVVSDANQQLSQEQLALAIEGVKDLDMTLEVTTKAGVRKHLLSRGIVIRTVQGTVQRVMGINWDKTKEVELERSLLSERMKMVNSAKMAALGEMSAGVAHEINNPLAIIVGKAEKLQRLLARPETTHDMLLLDLADIKKTAHRIASLIKGLRTFSRNSEHDPFMPVKLEALVTDTLSFCQERFRNSSVNLVVEPLPSLEFDARATQISQVLLNLLNNAFDAIHGTPNPWIKVETKAFYDENKIQFIVTDSGHGIPEQVAEKIMNPFFTTKDVGKGTGLGLSISSGMAQDHGGSLKLDRNCANTRFVLELPLVHHQKAAA